MERNKNFAKRSENSQANPDKLPVHLMATIAETTTEPAGVVVEPKTVGGAKRDPLESKGT